MVHLAQQPRLMVLRPSDTMQPALKAVMSRGFRFGVLAPCPGRTLRGRVPRRQHVSRPRARRSTRPAPWPRRARPSVRSVHSHRPVREEPARRAILHSSQAVVHTISQSLDLNETYQEIAMSAVSTVSGSSCLLLELNSETGDLVTVAASEPDASSLIGLRVRFRTGPEPGDAPAEPPQHRGGRSHRRRRRRRGSQAPAQSALGPDRAGARPR